jgi:hypothetical protein
MVGIENLFCGQSSDVGKLPAFAADDPAAEMPARGARPKTSRLL